MNLTNLFAGIQRFYIIIIITICSCISGIIHSSDDSDIFDNSEFAGVIETGDYHITRATTATIAELLIDVGAVTILKQEIFCHTNPLNTRQLLDLPIFWQPRKLTPYCWTLGTHAFYNQTERGYFTANSSSICSYLAINSPELLASLEPTAQKFLSDFSMSPIEVLPLFKNMTVQERRTGLMIHGDYQCKTAFFSFLMPIYYLENNFFLTENEVEEVEKVLGQASKDDTAAFAKKHMISDQIGLGDIRVYVNFPVMSYPHFNLRFGFFSTLPTAFAFDRGLLGSYFKRQCTRPDFNFTELFNLTNSANKNDKNQAMALAEGFVLGGLNNLAAMLLQSELGNDQHPTLGLCLHPTTALSKFIHRPWAESVFFKSNVTLEYLFPAKEFRSFVETASQNRKDFDALNLNDNPADIVARAKADPDYAQNVVNFLQGKFIDQLYPFAFQSKVHPGFIFHWSSTAFIESVRWGGLFGTDNWVQTAETLSNICVIRSLDGRPINIDVKKAIRPLAYQLKLVGSAFYKITRPAVNWVISLQVDDTVASTGIGKDFSLSLNFEANF